MEREHQLSTQEMKKEEPTEAASRQISSVVTGATSHMLSFFPPCVWRMVASMLVDEMWADYSIYLKKKTSRSIICCHLNGEMSSFCHFFFLVSEIEVHLQLSLNTVSG